MKVNLRKTMLEKLTKLSLEAKQNINNQIQLNLFDSDLWQQSKVIGITISKHIEWDTYKVILRAWEENKKVVVPVTNDSEFSMEFYLIKAFSDLEESSYEIYEPIDRSTKKHYGKKIIDLMIVPGVVFDEKGYRIGFGKGYFDRYLSDFDNQKVSLLADFQIIKQIPTNQYDISVDYLITDKAIIKVN